MPHCSVTVMDRTARFQCQYVKQLLFHCYVRFCPLMSPLLTNALICNSELIVVHNLYSVRHNSTGWFDLQESSSGQNHVQDHKLGLCKICSSSDIMMSVILIHNDTCYHLVIIFNYSKPSLQFEV